MAETKKRRVVLLDLDLKKGDAALQLDVTPNHGLGEALERPDRIDDLFLERTIVRTSGQFDLLASLEPLNVSIAFEQSAVQFLVNYLLDRYSYVIVDVPIEVAARLAVALPVPNVWVMVSNGTLASAREVERWRALIGRDSPEHTTLHVLNQHQLPGSLPDAEFVRAAGLTPDIVIPYDRKIAQAAIFGIKEAQNTPLRRGLGTLFEILSGESAEEPSSTLGRIFS